MRFAIEGPFKKCFSGTIPNLRRMQLEEQEHCFSEQFAYDFILDPPNVLVLRTHIKIYLVLKYIICTQDAYAFHMDFSNANDEHLIFLRTFRISERTANMCELLLFCSLT
jgi:hypothetical protein